MTGGSTPRSRPLFARGVDDPRPDAELLAAYRAYRDEAAFERLVARHAGAAGPDLPDVLAEELGRLAERDRLAVVLCDLEGLTERAAAARLGWAEGTVSSRLHRARRRLADRLRTRGVAGAGGVGVAQARVPLGLVAATVVSVRTGSLGGASTGSVAVAALVRHVLQEMTMRSVKQVFLATTLLIGLVAVGGVWPRGGERATAAPVPVTKPAPELTPAMAELPASRAVLREIGCTPERRVALEDHFSEQAAERDAKLAALTEIFFDERKGAGGGPALVAFQRKERAAATARLDQVKRALKACQIARLADVELQDRGVAAFTDPRGADALKLTDEQNQEVRAAVVRAADVKSGRPKSDGLLVGPGGVEGLRLAGFDGSGRAKACRAVEDSLTADQLAAWRQLVGELVAFDRFSPR